MNLDLKNLKADMDKNVYSKHDLEYKKLKLWENNLRVYTSRNSKLKFMPIYNKYLSTITIVIIFVAMSYYAYNLIISTSDKKLTTLNNTPEVQTPNSLSLGEISEDQQVYAKERKLEELIKNKYTYKDVSVRISEGQVRVTIKPEHYTKEEGENIIQLVLSELGRLNITVKFD